MITRLDRIAARRPARPLTLIVCAALLLPLGACGSGGSSGAGGAGGTDEPWTRAKPTWSSLYDVYFGPSGVAACTGGSTCHSDINQSGDIASNFVCPDKDACYTSLTGISHLVRPQDLSAPASAPLFAKLRQKTGAGKMPSDSSFVFAPEDIDVMTRWIEDGAKND
ncbi:MAG: hypothetical protein U0359_12030 [Byssovorax sp.]